MFKRIIFLILAFIVILILFSGLLRLEQEQVINDAKITKEDSIQLVESFKYLSSELDLLIEDSKDIYTYFYDKELKLKKDYITYSSRVVSRSSEFIINTSEVNSNNLTKNQILNLDLRTRSALTSYEIDNYILKGTRLEGLGEAFIKAEIKHNINALFLLSLGIHESAYGSSLIARDKNNLFGLGAYDSSPYKSAIYFNTKTEGIDYAANYIVNKYLNKNGPFYSNGYTLKHVNKRYASDPLWGEKIASHMYNLNSKILFRQEVSAR